MLNDWFELESSTSQCKYLFIWIYKSVHTLTILLGKVLAMMNEYNMNRCRDSSWRMSRYLLTVVPGLWTNDVLVDWVILSVLCFCVWGDTRYDIRHRTTGDGAAATTEPPLSSLLVLFYVVVAPVFHCVLEIIMTLIRILIKNVERMVHSTASKYTQNNKLILCLSF